jgi:hypothetical protein
MATMSTFFRRAETADASAESAAQSRTPAGRDFFALRPLPGEDLYIYTKSIDNSRIVPEPDPQARGACWSAIAVAGAALVLLTGVLFPSVANTMAGYKLEALRAENRRLLEERRSLELREAELTSPDRLQLLAQHRHMVAPQNGQVVNLNNKGDSAVAMVH